MVNNFTIIIKTDNHVSSQIIEHKRDRDTYTGLVAGLNWKMKFSW